MWIMNMTADRVLLHEALNELVRLRSGTEDPTRYPTRLYGSALEEWAGRLDMDLRHLDTLVMTREAGEGHPADGRELRPDFGLRSWTAKRRKGCCRSYDRPTTSAVSTSRGLPLRPDPLAQNLPTLLREEQTARSWQCCG